jgi:anti-sigma regulatory factor (Ser/Thr protein kinase)
VASDQWVPEDERRRRTPISEHADRSDALEGRFVHLSPAPASPKDARASLRWLDAHLSRERLDDLLLAVSELVSNSIVHAELMHERGIRVEAVVLPSCVRVEVSDSSPGYEPGPARLPPPGDAHGRGIWIVEQLADRWGYDPPGVSRIWFELDRRQ